MAPQGFSIDISKLPKTEGLGPLVAETGDLSRKSPPLSSTSPTARSASQKHSANNLTATTTHSTTSSSTSPPHAMSSVFGSGSTPSYPPRTGSPLGSTTSPSRNSPMRSRGLSAATPSPRHLSPATSQIFERDVQEPASLIAPELSAAVPSHILQTEDHIPAVLDQSVDVITDPRMHPADIEIVMHKDHVPAAAVAEAAVSGTALSDSGFADAASRRSSVNSSPPNAPYPSISAHLAPPPEDAALPLPSQAQAQQQGPSYGTVNPADPRRLSFISWADVVHAQHPEQHQQHHPLSQVSTPGYGRSPSPAAAGARGEAGSGTGWQGGLGGLDSGSTPASARSRSRQGSIAGAMGLSPAMAGATGVGRRGSVRNVEAGLPHGEERGELVVESMASALSHSRE